MHKKTPTLSNSNSKPGYVNLNNQGASKSETLFNNFRFLIFKGMDTAAIKLCKFKFYPKSEENVSFIEHISKIELS